MISCFGNGELSRAVGGEQNEERDNSARSYFDVGIGGG